LTWVDVGCEKEKKNWGQHQDFWPNNWMLELPKTNWGRQLVEQTIVEQFGIVASETPIQS
jgi:hypothetical protein